jgi:hypothetical protein
MHGRQLKLGHVPAEKGGASVYEPVPISEYMFDTRSYLITKAHKPKMKSREIERTANATGSK